MLSDTFVILDFETTGLYPERGDRITEVAAIRIRKDQVIDQYESLVNCGVRIPGFLQSWNGITQKMVDKAPLAKQVMSELLEFIAQDPIVAHNASFDQRVFANECRHARRARDDDEFICSMRVARRVYPSFRSHALQSLASRLRLSGDGDAHRAGPDAAVTAKLLIKMAGEIRAAHPGLQIDSAVLRRLMALPTSTGLTKL